LLTRRDGGPRPASDVADQDLITAAEAIDPTLEGKTARQKNPHPPRSLAWLSWIVAHLGGWNCYYPGPKTMRAGWNKLEAMAIGYAIGKAWQNGWRGAMALAGRRYILCRNHQEARKDAADRASILAALERQFARGDKALVSNTGFQRYLKTVGDQHFAIDPAKVEGETKFDGIFVLRTNTDLNPLEAMLCYKQLWTVEQTFRMAKHLLATRPIFHKLDETIRGHVFCSFLALVLKKALDDRIVALGRSGSWPEIIADLDSLTRDRDRARRQAFHRSLRPTSGCQPGPLRRGRWPFRRPSGPPPTDCPP
jgi:hypothetical protein